MRRKTGRVLFGVVDGEPIYEDFTPKRLWFWRRNVTEQSWTRPIQVFTGDDEACNPTIAITTWVGTMIFVWTWRLRSSTPPEFEAAFLNAASRCYDQATGKESNAD